MGMRQPIANYKNHRFPPEIIARAVWLYYRFPLSLRHVEEMLLERGIAVSYETIRRWGRKHGPGYVRHIRRKPPSTNDVWHLDEVAVRINGKRCWLWRALTRTALSRRDCPEPQEYQGCQTIADTSDEEAGHGAEADNHRQVAFPWRSKTSSHSRRRASLSQRFEQSSREFACSVSKTRANAPGVPLNRELTTFRLTVLCCPQSLRSRSRKTICYPNPQSQTASHGSVESRQRPDCLKQSARAVIAPVFANKVTTPWQVKVTVPMR